MSITKTRLTVSDPTQTTGGTDMTDMLRYKWTSFGPMLDEGGPFVLLVDAEAAIDAMRKGHGDPFHAANVAYGAGQNDGYMNGCADAIETAVQRVIELPDLIDAGFTYSNLLNREAVIDAIRGEQ
jgi:hypothetical protein